jgi:hypothetical protein
MPLIEFALLTHTEISPRTMSWSQMMMLMNQRDKPTACGI